MTLREDCVRLAEGLLNNYVIRLISGSEDHFQESYTYGIIREYVTLQSFQGLITMKVRRPAGVLLRTRACGCGCL